MYNKGGMGNAVKSLKYKAFPIKAVGIKREIKEALADESIQRSFQGN